MTDAPSSPQSRPLGWLKPDLHQAVADACAALVAASLPWSTSATSILVVVWVISLVPTIDPARFKATLSTTACLIPIAFVGLALAGMLWSDAAPAARLQAFSSTLKFLALPLLVYQFSQSRRAHWVVLAFIGSCLCLMMLSFAITIDPSLSPKKDGAYGVPVKNYIDQSQVFTFCAIFSLWPALHFLKARRYAVAAAFLACTLLFLANMALVNVSRTAILTIPVAVLIFLFTQLRFRHALMLTMLGGVFVATLGAFSPLVRAKVATIQREYKSYASGSAITSGGQRLEYWRQSARLVTTAPTIGYGTGSILAQFQRAEVDQPVIEAVANPHNQLFHAAIQWGMLGVAVILAMWAIHAVPFLTPGLAQGAGLLVVVQNVIGSQFNSHLTDFVPGWMYVLGVGVALGCASQGVPARQTSRAGARPEASAIPA